MIVNASSYGAQVICFNSQDHVLNRIILRFCTVPRRFSVLLVLISISVLFTPFMCLDEFLLCLGS